MRNKRSQAELAGELAAAADARLNGLTVPQLSLMLDIAKTALGDAQARASALDSKSLAAIGFSVALMVLTWPRLGSAPAATVDYGAAVITGLAAVIAAVFAGLGFTLTDVPTLTEERYLPPPTSSATYRFDATENDLLRRHLVSVHVLRAGLETANSTRGNYLIASQVALVVAAISSVLIILRSAPH
jgi:hypothetical protein